jgi:hypothetical protein
MEVHGGGRRRLWRLLFLMLVWSFENQRARAVLRREICMIWSLLFYAKKPPIFIVYKPLVFLFKTGLSSPYSSPIPLA